MAWPGLPWPRRGRPTQFLYSYPRAWDIIGFPTVLQLGMTAVMGMLAGARKGSASACGRFQLG